MKLIIADIFFSTPVGSIRQALITPRNSVYYDGLTSIAHSGKKPEVMNILFVSKKLKHTQILVYSRLALPKSKINTRPTIECQTNERKENFL